MSDTVDEINATYEGLANLEREFEDVETEISECLTLYQLWIDTKPI